MAFDESRAVRTSQLREIYAVHQPEIEEGNFHAHSAYTWSVSGGYVTLTIFGDGQDIRWVLSSITGDFETGPISHATGAFGAGTTSAEDTTDAQGPQPTKILALPDGNVVVVSDNEAEAVFGIRKPELGDERVEVFAVSGAIMADAREAGTLSLQGDAYHGEQTHRYITSVRPLGGQTKRIPQAAQFDIVSSDGQHWTPLGRYEGNTKITDRWVYRVSGDGSALEAADWQEPKVIRARLTGVASESLFPEDLPTAPMPNTGGTIVPLTPDEAGIYRWPAGFDLAGERIIPQPRSDMVKPWALCTDRTGARRLLWQKSGVGEVTDRLALRYTLIPANGINESSGSLLAGVPSDMPPSAVNRNSGGPMRVVFSNEVDEAGQPRFRYMLEDNERRHEFAMYLEEASVGGFPSYPVPHGSTDVPEERNQVTGWPTLDGPWALGFHLVAPDALMGHGIDYGEAVTLARIELDGGDRLLVRWRRGPDATTMGDLLCVIQSNGSEETLALGELYYPQAGTSVYGVVSSDGEQVRFEAATTHHGAFQDASTQAVLSGSPSSIHTHNDAGVVEAPIAEYRWLLAEQHDEAIHDLTGGQINRLPPRVTDVFVDGQGWSANFRQALAQGDLGDSDFGYRVPDGNAEPMPAPWFGIDRIAVRFSQPVAVSINGLELAGTRSGDLESQVTGFRYDSATDTAVWTLAEPLTADRYRITLGAGIVGVSGSALDGEHEPGDTLPSGDGEPGGMFSYRFNALPGDVDGNGVVLGSDVLRVRNRQFSTADNETFDTRADLDGSGSILGSDVIRARNHQFSTLPSE